jgi:hypothetical protein
VEKVPRSAWLVPLAKGFVERRFAGMAERRVPEIVAEGDRLDEVLVEAQGASDRPGDLGDLEAMRQPRPVMIAGVDENLCLVLESTERLAMKDAVPIALIAGSDGVRLFGTRPPRSVALSRSSIDSRTRCPTV